MTNSDDLYDAMRDMQEREEMARDDLREEMAEIANDRDRLAALNAKLVAALKAVVSRAEWNGRRQGWDIAPSLPAGTITDARALIAKARDAG